ncbi:hypothetical protein D3C84_1017700 [compost metagenome]
MQQLLAQSWDLAGQLFELMQRNGANHRRFQGNGITGIKGLANGVQANQLAGQMKAGDLLDAVLSKQVGLHRTGTQGIDAFYSGTCANQVLVLM